MVKNVKSILKVLMLLVTATLAVVQIQGCGGGGGGSSTTASTGTLKLSITDKQSDDFKSVVISIREIRVVPAGMENAADDNPGLPVIKHFDTPEIIDVMQLQFVQQALGEVVIPAGTYSQIRLILNPNQNGQPPANYLTLTSAPNSPVPLKTPSGQQSGLKVLGPIEVRAGVINAVMIDFDPNTAIVARGNGDYNLKPTGIRLVRMPGGLAQFGSISGNVLSTSKEWTSATISVKRRGSVNDTDPIAAGTIFSNYTSGAWQAPFAVFVPPSTATVAYKAFVAANGFQLYSSAAVPVATGQTTDLGDIHLTPTP